MSKQEFVGHTKQLAEFAIGARYENLPGEVVRECKRMLIDSLGCALGALDTESGRIGLAFADVVGGAPSATIVGTGRRTSPMMAAYANARLGGVLDADDTFPSLGHFGNTTAFTALATAEHYDRTGRDLITSIAVGFDLGARLCNAIGLPFKIEGGKVVGYTDRGGGSVSQAWAAIGAAASSARLSAQQTEHAFGIAGVNTPLPTLSEWAGLVDLPMMKVADPGWVSQMGIAAILLASLGSTGYSELLDRDVGFWRFFGGDRLDRDALLGGLGKDWLILDTTYKAWPSCRWIHYPLTALENLLLEHKISAEEIEKVIVRANPFSVSRRFHVQQPTTVINAQFSYAHSFAMLALNIPVGPAWYWEENMASNRVRAFRERVEVIPEPLAADLARWVERGQFRRLPGGVDVHARGRVFSETIDNARGDPWRTETLLTDRQLTEKFFGMVAPAGSKNEAHRRQLGERILDTVERLEEVTDLGEFLELLDLNSI